MLSVVNILAGAYEMYWRPIILEDHEMTNL